MTTRHLKIFLNVYITGSMTAAAQKLYMTQPSVSQAIRELEEHYGVPLFERLYRKLYPTQAGKQLFLYAENILGMFDDMEATMQADALPQSLELGLFFTAGMLVHPWLAEFRKRLPSTQIHIQVWKGSELKRRLRSAAIDLAIMEEFQDEPDLRQEIVAQDRLVAVTAVDDPLQRYGSITALQLSQAPLLLREKGAGVRDAGAGAGTYAAMGIRQLPCAAGGQKAPGGCGHSPLPAGLSVSGTGRGGGAPDHRH